MNRYEYVDGRAVIPSRYAPKVCPHCGADPFLGEISADEKVACVAATALGGDGSFLMTGRCRECGRVPGRHVALGGVGE